MRSVQWSQALGRSLVEKCWDPDITFVYREKERRWVLKQKIWVKSVMGAYYLNVRRSVAVSENSTG